MNRPTPRSLAVLFGCLLVFSLSACEGKIAEESTETGVDGGTSVDGCDPGAFYSCVCDDGADGLAECDKEGNQGPCQCEGNGSPDGAAVDVLEDQASPADTADAMPPLEDTKEEPKDAEPKEDTAGPSPTKGTRVDGTILAKIGEEKPFLYAGAIAYLEREDGTQSMQKPTGIRGHFKLHGIEPGSWRLCATAKGLEEPTCGKLFQVGLKPASAPPLEVIIPGPSAWGLALLSNEKPCVYRYQDFKVQVDTLIKTETDMTVRANIHGQFVVPGYEGPLTASCENAQAFSESVGQKKTVMIFPGEAPKPGPIVVAPLDGGSAMRPNLNSTVKVSVNVKDPDGDPVLVRWYSNVGSSEIMEGEQVSWKMPKSAAKAVLYGLLSDGMGHHVRVASTVRPGIPLVYEGQLRDAQGGPIVGAKIQVNEEQVTTGEDGSYELQITQNAPRYVISVTHPKYTPCMQVQHDSWRGHLIEQLTAGPQGKRCMKSLQTQTFPATEGVTLKSGLTKITFPEGAFKNPQGQTIMGPVEVAWYFGAPGEPLAAEPAVMNEGKVAFAETLGAMYVSFRNPTNPNELVQMDAKNVMVEHAVPKDVTYTPDVRVATANSKTGGMELAPGGVEFTGEQWLYPFPGTEKLFAPTVPLPVISSARVHMPATRFPGSTHLAALVKVPHSTLPQLLVRPVTAGIVSFPVLPQGSDVELIMYRQDKNTSKADKAVGLRELAVTSIFTEEPSGPFFEGPLSYALFPFDASSLDFLLELFQRRGTFLNYYELEAYDPGDGSDVVDPVAFAQSYYTAIDPLAQKTTLMDWLDSLDWSKPDSRSQLGDEAFAIYGNAGDLDFGREMHLQVYDHDDDPATPDVVAMYTVNYEDVRDASRGLGIAATVAMEYSPHPVNGGEPYIKFFLFDAAGNRGHQIDLDGEGQKTLPNLCLNCHGGRPPSTEEIYNNGMEYPDDGRLGDMSRYIPYALETFDYAFKKEYTRSFQEEDFRKLNESLLKTNINTTTRALLHGMYGSPYDENDTTLAQPGATQDEHWVPTGMMFDADGGVVGGDWSGHEELYQSLYQPYCRACHLSFDYQTLKDADTFFALGGVIQSYLCDDETYMPQAKVTQRALFGDDDALQLLIDEMNANANSPWAATCP